MERLPTISVVIPARNAAEEAARAARSALGQTVAAAEVIVVDDASSAQERERLHELLDPAVRLIDGPGRGAAAARNGGLRAARGDWVAFLDADDTWYDGHLEALRDSLAGCPEARVCFGAAVQVSEDGQVLNRTILRSHDADLEGVLTRRLQPTTSATAVDRRGALALGGFFEGFRHPAGVEDGDLWWRIAARHPCATQPRPLVAYVVHERRDSERAWAELRDLSLDRGLLIARIREAVPDRLFRVAAAHHRAEMARLWYAAGFVREGRQEARASLRWAPTLNGAAALVMGLVPHRSREAVRRWRRVVLGRTGSTRE